MREMGQSAWLSTSFLTLQGSEGRVNVRLLRISYFVLFRTETTLQGRYWQ